MYYPHPALTLPSKETVIWHYFSLAKFLSLLNDSKLYFPRSDKFEDQMEGRFSAADKNLYEIMGNPSMPERIEKGCAGCAYINCWVMSEEELFLMWSAYSSLEEGIAIKSSVGNLISSLDASDTREIYISNVSYIDYEKQRTFDKTGRIVNALAPYFCKRKYFSQERELRLVHYDFHIRPHHNIEGMEFDVALETLIDEIWMAPKAHDWFVDMVNKELKLHDISIQAKISKLTGTLA